MKKAIVLLFLTGFLFTGTAAAFLNTRGCQDGGFKTNERTEQTAFLKDESESAAGDITYYQWRNAETFLEHNAIRDNRMKEWKTKSLIEGWDSFDVPYINGQKMIPDDAVIAWRDDWTPYSYKIGERTRVLLPQIWEHPVSLQDLCALYMADGTWMETYISPMSLDECIVYLDKAEQSDSSTFKKNMECLKLLAERQAGRCNPIEDKIEADLDHDGTKEVIEVRKSENEKDEWLEYSLFVNGQNVETFQSYEMSFEVLNLDHCSIIQVKMTGGAVLSSDENRAEIIRRSRQSVLYGYVDRTPRFLGAINGAYVMFLSSGRFLTIGDSDTTNGYDGLYSFAHEYGVTQQGQLYHVLHGKEDKEESPFGWQQANTVWKLRADLPVFSENGYTVSNQILKSGTHVLICGASENGYLYFVDEEGQSGVVRLIRGDIYPEDPYVAPGGRQLSFYLAGYDGIAYAE